MTRRDKLLQVIEQDLFDDQADYRQLKGLMQSLYEQLMRRDCSGIDHSNALISDYLERLGARAERRSKVLAAFGLAAGDRAMDALFLHYPEPRAQVLRQAWRGLGQLALDCKALNDRNGRLLAMHHDLLNQLLIANPVDHLYQPQHY